jgi:hypothetical protein
MTLARERLVLVVPSLFAGSFPRQGCLDSFPFTWFEIKRMLLDFFDDVLLLDLALKAAESTF